MEYMGCREAAFDVFEEASEKFKGLYVINVKKKEKLEEICDLVDEVFQIFDDEFGCDALTVDVDETTKELIFNIVCDEIILQHGRTHKFFELVGLVDAIRFSKAKPSSLRIEVVVSELWLMGECR